MPNLLRRLLLLIVPLALALDSTAQAPDALTADDCARAEKFMGYNANPLVYHAVHPAWTAGELLWYRDTGADGARFVLFDPAKLTKEPAFEHAKLAAALSAAGGRKYEAHKLPFNAIEVSADGKSVSFSAAGRRYRCDRERSQCVVEPGGAAAGGRFRTDAPSPDKKKTAFIREYNLWVRDIATGKETQLTADGVKDNSYARDNAGWVKTDRAILVWSPDSKKIATFQQDQRNVG
jgi:hypothetical protein